MATYIWRYSGGFMQVLGVVQAQTEEAAKAALKKCCDDDDYARLLEAKLTVLEDGEAAFFD